MEKTLGAMANAAKLLRESLDSNSRYENAINDDEKYMDALEDAVSNAYDMNTGHSSCIFLLYL